MCSTLLLASAFITSVGDQCDFFFFVTRSFLVSFSRTKTLINELLCLVYLL